MHFGSMGGFDDIIGFQERCFPDEQISMQRTSEPWNKPRSAPSVAATLL